MIQGLDTVVKTIRNATYGKDMREAIAVGFELLSNSGALIDKTLTLDNYAADAKVVGDKFIDIEEEISAISASLSEEEKNVLLAYFAEQVEIHPTLSESYQAIYDMWRKPVESVLLDRQTLNLGVGMSVTLHPIFTPSDAYDKTGIWSVDPEGIVQCTNGTVFGIANGSAVVTFTSNSGNKTASCSVSVSSSVYHSITRNLTNVNSSNNDDSIIEGDPYTTTLTPLSSSYRITSVTVNMGGNDITSTCYSEETGIIQISSVTGDIVITASATNIVYYTINYNLEGCQSSSQVVQIEEGSSYLTTLTPTTSGHVFNSYQVTMGGLDVTSTVAEKIDDDNISISISSVTGNVSIFAEASLPTDLNSTPWDMISQISSNGQASNYYSVGDEKEIVLNGTVGNLTFSNYTVSIFIIGINHNSSVEGRNRIHFMIGKKDGKLIAFCDSEYNNITYDEDHFIISRDGSGFYDECPMRVNILGGTNTPSSPGTNTFISCLPNELRAVMKTAAKCVATSDSYGGTINEYITLGSEYEVYGATSYGLVEESENQLRYEYFHSGNSKNFYKHDSTSTLVKGWTRTMAEALDYVYVTMNTNGFMGYDSPYRSLGISPIIFV